MNPTCGNRYGFCARCPSADGGAIASACLQWYDEKSRIINVEDTCKH